MLLAERALALRWEGVGGNPLGRDYDVACAVDDYVGVVRRHDGDFLVLADEPLQSTLLPSWGQWLVVRWWSCASIDVAEAALAAVPRTLSSLSAGVDFVQAKPGAVLFDSACAGIDVVAQAHTVPLPAGRYRVTTERYASQAPPFNFVVHRLIEHG